MGLVQYLVGTGTLATVALASALGATQPPVLAASDPPWLPPPCTQDGVGDASGSVPAGAAWYRLDPVLDRQGTLAGQRLTLGVDGGGSRHLDLPPESFASGPVAGVVLVGEDDGVQSRLRLLDTARGCATEVGVEDASVVRDALLAPDGSTIWEHRISRAGRVDDGVWRRPVPGGAPVRVLTGMPVDARFGPTFATELSLTADGRLGVATCGERACRARVLEPDTGKVATFEGTGPLLGVHGNRAVAHAACAGLPCPILEVDLQTGAQEILVDAAGLAAIGGAPDGTALVFEEPDGTLATVDLDTGDRTPVAADAGLLPVRRTSCSPSGAETPAGSVLLADGGRVSQPSAARRIDPATHAVVALGEVLP